MGKQEAAILLTLVVHVIGVGVLIWGLVLGSEERPDWRGWWRGVDDPDDDRPPEGPVAPGGGALPLPDSDPSSVRLRAPGRIAVGYRRPARRPDHEPQPDPAPAPPR